ncbi:MAG: hypothetical protein IT429_21875 [Gemmataceae bacterium]|nr:hypothetical protein [Gemmataceae bacterium]
MSRAYRICVREALNRVIRAEDHVSTQLEVLEILPCEQMAELLAAELEARGFERKGMELVREEGGAVITVDATTATVTVRAESAEQIEIESEHIGWAADQQGEDSRRVREQVREELKKDLEGKVGKEKAKLQSQVTDRLEAQLGDIKKELNQAVNRVTAEALKRKAAQLGQIKEMTEDPASGSMTIVLEV